jgi:hypothetical protein
MVMCYYDPAHTSGATDLGNFFVADGGLFVTGGASSSPFDFPMLSSGDRIFIYNNALNQTGGGTQTGAPNNDYTIRRFVPVGNVPNQTFKIEFNEHFALGTTGWLETGYAYRAGWVPPAVRCTLRIKDAKAQEIRTISRTFKVLASS